MLDLSRFIRGRCPVKTSLKIPISLVSLTILSIGMALLSSSGASSSELSVECCRGQEADGEHAVYISPGASAEDLEERIKSADRLIPSARRLNDSALEMIRLASNVTEAEGGSSSYRSLLSQYNQALDLYREHRREYLTHVKRYHEQDQGPKVSSPYVPIGKLADLKPLKLQVSDKCQQLVELETRLLANEKQVMTMLENLYAARNKESDAEFFNMWSSVQQLAVQNRDDAMTYNHLGLSKTSASSERIHDMITTATRDGILAYQQQVYGKFQRNNALENAINQRSNMHTNFSLMVLSRLNSLKPTGYSIQGPGDPSYNGDQLQAESDELNREYAMVQALYRKLQMAQSGK